MVTDEPAYLMRKHQRKGADTCHGEGGERRRSSPCTSRHCEGVANPVRISLFSRNCQPSPPPTAVQSLGSEKGEAKGRLWKEPQNIIINLFLIQKEMKDQ
jgi:hypothetical protein